MHWFDEYTIGLATKELSRRKVVGGLLGLAASGLWTRSRGGLFTTAIAQEPRRQSPAVRPSGGTVPGHSGKPARSGRPRGPISKTLGPCHIVSDPAQPSFDYSGEVSFLERPLRFTLQVERHFARASLQATPTLESTVIADITFQSELVTHAEYRYAPTPLERNPTMRGTIEIRGGPSVRGLSAASLTFQEGRVSGTVNGKAIAPAPITPNLEFQSLRFVDGSPVPAPSFGPPLDRGLQQLREKAENELRTCLRPNTAFVPPGSSVSPGPGCPPNTPGGASSDDPCSAPCYGCASGCQEVYYICTAGSIFTFGLSAALAGCTATDFTCQAACWVPPAGCCETFCFPFLCCNSGDSCCGPNLCCGQGHEVCASFAGPGEQINICCPEDHPVGCGAPGGFCCEPGANCCQRTPTCCPQNTVCVEGGPQCCPSDLYCPDEQIFGGCCPNGFNCQTASNGAKVCCDKPLCGSACCLQDEVCQNGNVCCPPGVPICKGVCCRSGQCGANGECCSLDINGGKLCGTVCCPVFSTCCGNGCCTGNDQCINGACCPQNQVCGGICCPPGQGCQNPATQTCGTCAAGLVTCVPTDGSAPVCCPPDITCCGGKCCPPGLNICGAGQCSNIR